MSGNTSAWLRWIPTIWFNKCRLRILIPSTAEEHLRTDVLDASLYLRLIRFHLPPAIRVNRSVSFCAQMSSVLRTCKSNQRRALVGRARVGGGELPVCLSLLDSQSPPESAHFPDIMISPYSTTMQVCWSSDRKQGNCDDGEEHAHRFGR